MPYGDEKHQLIYDELVNILGERYVEDDLGIMEAYYRDALTPVANCKGRFEFVVLPGCVEDVQQIMKLANRYTFPVSISGSGMCQPTSNAVPGYDYWCFVDPKRLDEITIDPKNMNATVGAYVAIGQLQCEALKYGLFHGIPGASTTATVVGTNMFTATHWTCWRTGAGRNLLGVEWVLPSGEILRTGSWSVSDDGFWGTGPGPDPRGVIRGQSSHLGSLGLVTRMKVKLHPIPALTEWPTDGVPQPEKKSLLPQDYFRSFIMTFPTPKASVDAIAAMGKAEIGGYCLKFTPWDYVCWYATSMESFWEEWFDDFWTDERKNGHSVAVGLWGYAGPKQVDYEEKVLMQIMEEHGGKLYPEPYQTRCRELMDACTVRDAYRHRFTRLSRAATVGGGRGNLYDVLEMAETSNARKPEYTPPLGEQGLDQFKFWTADFGHQMSMEIDAFGERTTEFDSMLGRISADLFDDALKNNKFPPQFSSALHLASALKAPEYRNVAELFGKIKMELDPNNISNPTRMFDLKAWIGETNMKESGLFPVDLDKVKEKGL